MSNPERDYYNRNIANKHCPECDDDESRHSLESLNKKWLKEAQEKRHDKSQEVAKVLRQAKQKEEEEEEAKPSAQAATANTLRDRARKASAHTDVPSKLCSEKGCSKKVREFNTGATRDSEDGKLDYEGFLSPSALKRYAKYMHSHRKQSDGKMRDSDNWQKGIPLDCYMKSLCRHVVEMWTDHRSGLRCGRTIEDLLCAVIFNAFGYLHEIMKEQDLVPYGIDYWIKKEPPAEGEESKPTGCFYCRLFGSCSLLKERDDNSGENCVVFVRKEGAGP